MAAVAAQAAVSRATTKNQPEERRGSREQHQERAPSPVVNLEEEGPDSDKSKKERLWRRRSRAKRLNQNQDRISTELTIFGANHEKYKKKMMKPRFLIDPRYSKFAQGWDVVTMLALIFTALVTPFEVCHSPPCRSSPH